MANNNGSALMAKRRVEDDSRNIIMTRNPLMLTAIRIWHWDVSDRRAKSETLGFGILRRPRQL